MELNPTEAIGYFATVVVLIGFLMKNLKALRLVNTIGCSLFVIYGMMLHYNFPMIITNGAIICINLYFIIKDRIAQVN